MRDFSDKRRSKRVRSLLRGRIIFNNRCSVLDCTIRDLSETGARIAFAHPVPIPADFELDIPKKGSTVRATVMWSNGNEHGVMFIDQPDAHRAPTLPPDNPRVDPAALGIQDILEATRHRIAELAGVSVDAVKLTLDIDRPN